METEQTVMVGRGMARTRYLDLGTAEWRSRARAIELVIEIVSDRKVRGMRIRGADIWELGHVKSMLGVQRRVGRA